MERRTTHREGSDCSGVRGQKESLAFLRPQQAVKTIWPFFLGWRVAWASARVRLGDGDARHPGRQRQRPW